MINLLKKQRFRDKNNVLDENQFLEEVSIKFCQTLSDFPSTIKHTDVYNDISLFISKNQNPSIEQKTFWHLIINSIYFFVNKKFEKWRSWALYVFYCLLCIPGDDIFYMFWMIFTSASWSGTCSQGCSEEYTEVYAADLLYYFRKLRIPSLSNKAAACTLEMALITLAYTLCFSRLQHCLLISSLNIV